jgi:hypothetical protein
LLLLLLLFIIYTINLLVVRPRSCRDTLVKSLVTQLLKVD